MEGSELDLESREAQIVRAAAARDRRSLQTLLEEEADSTHLFSLACMHGLVAVLSQQLETGPSGCLKKSFVAFLAGIARQQRQTNVRRGEALCEAFAALRAGGIPALAFGGAALAFTTYPDPGLRQFDELRLLVERQSVGRARAALERLGYAMQAAESDPPPKANHIELRRAGGGATIQIHWNIAPPGFPARLDYAFFAQAGRTLPVAGCELPVFSKDDELLAACVHGSTRYWLRLKLLCDVAELLRAGAGLDGEWLLGRARGARCTRALLLGLAVVNRVLGCSIPEAAALALQRQPRVVELADYCQRRLRSNVGSPPQGAEKLVFNWKLLDSGPARLGYAWRWIRTHRGQLKHPLRLARAIAAGLAPAEAAIFVPTREEVVLCMLETAGVGPDDVVYDLGCGDGRILILAAQRFGARGVGFELDPQRAALARRNARKAGVAHRVEFRQQDFTRADLSPASVVTLYLYGAANIRLRSKLLRELKPGSRIVSHDFNMGDWAPARKVEVPHKTGGGKSTVFLWVVPPPGSDIVSSPDVKP